VEYREATDYLLRRVTLDDIAGRLGVSVQSLKQARLDPDNPGYRTPPPGWKAALSALAQERGLELLDFSASLADPE
jgi:hypothetical protein